MSIYKVVRMGSEYHVVLASYDGSGLEYRPYGSYQECLERAERLATTRARNNSGPRKGKRIVVRRGDVFIVQKVSCWALQDQTNNRRNRMHNGGCR